MLLKLEHFSLLTGFSNKSLVVRHELPVATTRWTLGEGVVCTACRALCAQGYEALSNRQKWLMQVCLQHVLDQNKEKEQQGRIQRGKAIAQGNTTQCVVEMQVCCGDFVWCSDSGGHQKAVAIDIPARPQPSYPMSHPRGCSFGVTRICGTSFNATRASTFSMPSPTTWCVPNRLVCTYICPLRWLVAHRSPWSGSSASLRNRNATTRTRYMP